LVGCVERPPADASGAEIYEAVCARCHGEDLSGGIGPPIGPESNAAAQDDDFLRLTITAGRGRMPSFRNTLSTQQIERVIEHLRSEQE
jgi:mono/diheme cytochrome c family protein